MFERPILPSILGVHLVGGAAGLSAALILGPRHGKYDPSRKKLQSCSMTNVLLGVFMLWWGWLGFNCGSTFGLSGGGYQTVFLVRSSKLMFSQVVLVFENK